MWHTAYFTVLAVVLPLVAGTFAAVVFNRRFPVRGLLRTIFILPMMATPVAIALVWTMMFLPQLGVLNYLLSVVGIPPSEWVFHQHSHSKPRPSRSLALDSLRHDHRARWPRGGARGTLRERAARRGHSMADVPLYHLPARASLHSGGRRDAHHRRGEGLRGDLCHLQRRPGTASETINLYLYSQAFAYYNVGTASTVVVVFFAIILLLSVALLWVRERSKWYNK